MKLKFLIKKYLSDTPFRVRISLYVSFLFNLIYAFFKLGTGLYYRSVWWSAVAVYYILLSSIRFALLRYLNRPDGNTVNAFEKYRLCGVFMAGLNIYLSIMVFVMLRYHQPIIYSDLVIVASAFYTFCTVSLSVIDIARYRKHEDPLLSAANKVRFATALVSLFSLETAILSSYGSNENLRQTVKGITGFAICGVILGLSAYMIIYSSKKIAEIGKK